MGKEILTFGDIGIEKNKFYSHKSLVPLRDVDIVKVLVSKKISFNQKSHKYFIGYLHNHHKVTPLHIMLPKTNAFIKSYDGQIKWMYFLIADDNLLGKYNTICDKVSADIKRKLIGSLCTIKNF